jgi:adenylylsulfate kinase
MDRFREARYRSVAKALSWRALATLTTMSIVFVFTRKPLLSLEVGVVEVIVKLLIYYMHERLWLAVGFGKRQHPLAGLSVTRPLDSHDMEEVEAKLRELGYIE